MSVSIIIGSISDKDKMQPAMDALREFGITSEMKVLSAHRTPALLKEYIQSAETKGAKIFICAAGMAAHLAGAVAGMTCLPVIGVPLSGSALNGVDSLYSTVQMPKGIPVATVAIDGAYNAGILAVQMLSLTDPALNQLLKKNRESMVETIVSINQQIG